MDQHFRTVMRGLEGLTATVTREMDSMQSCLGRVESRLARMEDRLEAVESRLALAAATAANTTSDHNAATPHPGAHTNDPDLEAVSTDDRGGPHVWAVCAWCRKGQAKLICGHCKDARYCSQEVSANRGVKRHLSIETDMLPLPPSYIPQCQRSHWKKHKGPCKAKRTAARFVNSVLYLVVARGFAKNVLPALRLCRDTWRDERVWRVIINTAYTYKLPSQREKPRPCTETRLIRECRRLCSDFCLPPHPATHGAAEATTKRLLSYGADANVRGGALCEAWEGKVKKYSYVENTMALVLAARAGRSSVCRILLEAGAIPSIPFTDKDFPRLQTALGEAAKNGDLQLIKVMGPFSVSSLFLLGASPATPLSSSLQRSCCWNTAQTPTTQTSVATLLCSTRSYPPTPPTRCDPTRSQPCNPPLTLLCLLASCSSLTRSPSASCSSEPGPT